MSSLNCEGGTWVGETQVSWREKGGAARTQKIFQVAVAGPFGQAKYRAHLNWSGARFEKSDSLHHVFTIIRGGRLQEYSRLSLGFVTSDGVKHLLEVGDLNDLGDLGRLKSLVQEFDDALVLQLLGAVRDRLDSEAVWATISDMAECLRQEEQLASHEAIAILQNHRLE